MNSELVIALMLPDRLSQVVMQLFKDAACVISVNHYLSVGSERNMVTLRVMLKLPITPISQSHCNLILAHPSQAMLVLTTEKPHKKCHKKVNIRELKPKTGRG